MSETRVKGWYPAPEGGGRQRYWDGDDWSGPSVLPPPMPPAAWILGGLLGSLTGAALTAVGLNGDAPVLAFVGYAAAVVGGIVAAIGVIAAGVRLGLRHAAWDERQR